MLMAKKASIKLKNGSSEEISFETLEEDRHFEHVAGLRFCDSKGNLVAKFEYDQVAQMSVSEE
jgi:hypothetical protein